MKNLPIIVVSTTVLDNSQFNSTRVEYLLVFSGLSLVMTVLRTLKHTLPVQGALGSSSRGRAELRDRTQCGSFHLTQLCINDSLDRFNATWLFWNVNYIIFFMLEYLFLPSLKETLSPGFPLHLRSYIYHLNNQNSNHIYADIKKTTNDSDNGKNDDLFFVLTKTNLIFLFNT